MDVFPFRDTMPTLPVVNECTRQRDPQRIDCSPSAKVTSFAIALSPSRIIIAVVSLVLCDFAHAAGAKLTFSPADEGPAMVTASGAPAESTLSLHLIAPETGKQGPAVLADQRASEQGQILQLTPRFTLVSGSTYRAILSHDGKVIAQTDWQKPAIDAPAPLVSSIYPSNTELPANLLKFHITFSEPMRQSREIFDLIHLVDTDNGKAVEAPWRRQELWSEDLRRLTLWIHPGRVKQGVNLRKTMGPVLQPDKNYALIIEAGLLSLPGKATADPTQKKFTTLAEDHNRPSAKTWQLTLPHIGTREPLIIESPEPLDTPLALRYLSLTDNVDAAVKHTLVTRDIGDQKGHRFAFLPGESWRNEPYTIHAGKFLEDLAGNTPSRVFDTDLDNPVAEPSKADLQRIFRPLPEGQ